MSSLKAHWYLSWTWENVPEPIRSILHGFEEDIKTLLNLDVKLAHSNRFDEGTPKHFRYGIEIWDSRPHPNTWHLADLYVCPEMVRLHRYPRPYDKGGIEPVNCALTQPDCVATILKAVHDWVRSR